MYSKQKLLEMISSEKSSTRYDACEWLRVSQESSPEVINALEKATHDTDPEVAMRANHALQADVHHRQAVTMGLAAPDAREIEADAQASIPPEVRQIEKLKSDHATMNKEIRSWGIWLLVFGVLQLISFSVLDRSWGVLLIIISLASFYFRSASLFIIYGVTLAWAAIYNFSGFNVTWGIIALFQVYATVRIFLNYRRFHKAELENLGMQTDRLPESLSADRAARFFPWISAFLGSIAFIGLVSCILIEVIIAIESRNTTALPGYLSFFMSLSVNIGVLGFAGGLASLLSHYRPKALGILAVVTGILTLLIELALIILNFIL